MIKGIHRLIEPPKTPGKKNNHKYPRDNTTISPFLRNYSRIGFACGITVTLGEDHPRRRCRSNEMPGTAQYLERGGLLQRFRDSSEDDWHTSGDSQLNNTTSSGSIGTEHDFRFPRRPDNQFTHPTSANQLTNTYNNSQDQTKSSGASATDQEDKLDHPESSRARDDLLGESFFPTWKDGSAGEELDNTVEMQKKDPLATQIWKLYSKTKKTLPNQERLENLTWRMMAMNLRKRQQEENARYEDDESLSAAKDKSVPNNVTIGLNRINLQLAQVALLSYENLQTKPL